LVAARLGLPPAAPASQATLQALAAELYEWARTQQDEAKRFGLKVNRVKGELTLVCRAPQPLLKREDKAGGTARRGTPKTK
jgi:hypothetical protein